MLKRKTLGVWLPLLALAGPGLAAAATLKVTPPKIEVADHTLANGLRVLLYQDHSVPLANIQLWYHVGSRDEKKGRSGFAHMFEHLMFKGSANLGPEEHANFIQSIGGRYNATTDFDRTLYWETIPSNYLERLLWMEADRLKSLDVSDENFKSEREVVKEERRLRVDNPPFGRLFEIVLAKSYTTHPYKILPIGIMDDLNAATVEDIRDFHSLYYVPNNATLVVAGDFDPAQVMRWFETYFGPIPKGKPIPRSYAAEPAQHEERRTVVYDSRAPLPAVILAYHVPKDGDPDLYALQVAARILSSGRSSRLYRKLVYEKQIAISASGQAQALEDPGVFFFNTIVQQGHKPEEAEQALVEEVERLKKEPVADDELAK
ncbi:MAG TPA: pitrilysin family protein, partial [Thermoanaerobaculia bacterium]